MAQIVPFSHPLETLPMMPCSTSPIASLTRSSSSALFEKLEMLSLYDRDALRVIEAIVDRRLTRFVSLI